MMKVDAKKAIQRKQGLTARKSLLSESAAEKSCLITKKVLELDFYKNAKTILSYFSFDGEVDTKNMNYCFKNDGKITAFPLCLNDGIMVAAFVDSDKYFEKGKYGIIAPCKDAAIIIKPRDIDLVIVPCVAFCGKTKMRIGWGSGYYDRFLPKCINAKTVALAFEVQHLYDMAYNDRDIPIDVIVSEKNVYKK